MWRCAWISVEYGLCYNLIIITIIFVEVNIIIIRITIIIMMIIIMIISQQQLLQFRHVKIGAVYIIVIDDLLSLYFSLF